MTIDERFFAIIDSNFSPSEQNYLARLLKAEMEMQLLFGRVKELLRR